MPSKQPTPPATLFLLALALIPTGCTSAIHTHAVALASATAPVVDQAAAAYAGANTIHIQRTDYDAIAAFDAPPPAPIYNPRTVVPPLLSDKDIHVRLAVLAAFQEYVKSVAAITSGTDSPELQASAKSAGQDLTSLGGALTATVNPAQTNPITPTIQNATSTAIDALAQFLINRKTKKELPPIIVAMDPNVKTLCDLLQSDIATLKELELFDYNFILNQQTLFLTQPASKLDPTARREQIMKLPAIARRQRASDQQLTQLSAAIVRLELTHHALAAEAQGNNPESLKNKLGELEAAGKDLGNFYSSLSASTD
jgi:hypothetical protein